MNSPRHLSQIALAAGVGLLLTQGLAQAADGPYKVLDKKQYMGNGGIDYIFADNDGRKVYIWRGAEVLAFDEDTLAPAGTIPNARAHGATVDPQSHHGFCSSKPVVMWDTTTMQTIKTIPVDGGPDGILFEPATERVYVLSHGAPNVTVIEGKDGTVAGTIDLGGAPEQGQSDGMGHVYIDVEDRGNVAVVDAKTMQVTAHYDFGGKGDGAAGLALDIKNGILFAMCRSPQPTCIIMSAKDGKIITTLPLAGGSDGAVFNPATMEAFSSQGNGTLTIIKETSPTTFEVEQNLTTIRGAKCCTLDTKNNHVLLNAIEAVTPPPATADAAATNATPPTAAAPDQGGGRRGGRGGRGGGPGNLDIIVVGR